MGVLLANVLSIEIAQSQSINYLSHCYIPKDSLIKQEVSYIKPGSAGKDIEWDFSVLTTLTDEYVLKYDGKKDSICSLEHRTRYIYSQNENGIKCVGFENANTYIKFDKPFMSLPFQFTYGDSMSTFFSGNGEYGNGLSLHIKGKQTITADAIGTIILPYEKLNVLRIKSVETFKTSDSIEIEKTTYKWYSSDCRYPVFESVETVFHTTAAKDSTVFNASFIYSANQQEKRIMDTDNAIDIFGYNYMEQMRGTEALEISYFDVYPNPVKENTTVWCNINQQANILIYLYSENGISYYSTEKIANAGENKWKIPTFHLPKGSYIIRISTNAPKSVSKVIIKE